MAYIGVIAVGKISHLVCHGSMQFKVHCGVDPYSKEGKATLYVGSIDGTEDCPTCARMNTKEDDASWVTYATDTKSQPNEELLEEVYGLVGTLNSDTCNSKEYSDAEKKLEIAQAELNTRLTACGFLSKGA